MRIGFLAGLALLAAAACARNEELTDEKASKSLEEYVVGNFCQHSTLGDTCKDAALASMAALTETSPTERKAGGQVKYEAGKPCTTEVTAVFSKAAAGGWVISKVEGQTLCGPPENTGAWGSPASFSLRVQ